MYYININEQNARKKKYYKSNHWKTLRDNVLSLFPKCQVCNSKADHVHHRRYKNLYDVTQADLISICESCHSKAHNAMNQGKLAADADHDQIRKAIHVKFKVKKSKIKQPPKRKKTKNKISNWLEKPPAKLVVLDDSFFDDW